MQINYKKYIPDLIKYHNQLVVLLWKLGWGKLLNCCPALFGRTLVIGQPGRGTGSPNQTAANYISQGDLIYCAPIFGGTSDWYLNVIANPQVEIWLPDGWYAGSAEIVEEAEERAGMLRKLLTASGLAAPLFTGIDPQRMDEERFRAASASYHLLRISRQSPRTGADGPGSLAWLWPLIFIFLLLRGRRRK